MKQTYRIAPASNLVEITGHAQPTFEEWAQTMQQIFDDAQFATGYHFLFDNSLIEAPTKSYIAAIARFISLRPRKIGRCAILVRGLLAYGMGRMTEAYCERDDVRAFTGREAAIAWLRVSDPVLPLRKKGDAAG